MPLLADLATRAGGGHSFSGGGTSGGGGFHSSGGGGVFFAGGGGGGGGGGFFGFIFLIVIVFVVLGIVMAVRRGGGRGASRSGSAINAAAQGYGPSSSAAPSWTGTQQPAMSTVRGDVFPGTDAAADAGPGPTGDGLGQILAHDPAFNEEAFLEQVQKAFFVVQEAWTERKPDMSRQVMADGLWQSHRVQIQQYVEEHKRNVLADLAVGDVDIIAAHSDQTYDTITVRVLAACADYDVDDEKGKVIRGNRSVEQWREDWTFQRSSNATTKTGGGTLSSKCPNCGAPLDVDLQGICKYCKAPVMSGDYDWVLARISQVM